MSTHRTLARATLVRVTRHVKQDLGCMDTDAFFQRLTVGKVVNQVACSTYTCSFIAVSFHFLLYA